MGVYRRGKNGTWYARLWHGGREIRQSTGTRSKRVAEEIERKLRDDLARRDFGVSVRAKPVDFRAAGERWLGSKSGISPRTRRDYEQLLAQLDPAIGHRLVSSISSDDIAAYQRRRTAEGLGPRRVNYEVSMVRQVLSREGEWKRLAEHVHWFPEPKDVGRALDAHEERRLLDAAGGSGSPALLTLLVLSLDTGLRRSELRGLRHRDLRLEWREGVVTDGWLTVAKSKTPAGTGRTVPLSQRARGALSLWLSRPELSEPKPEHFVFPEHAVAVGRGRPILHSVNPDKPMGDWKTAWRTALRLADIRLRWHDLRHTFITRLAENPNVSEQTIRSLAGHVSKAMLDRYSHVRNLAKQQAIQALEGEQPAQEPAHPQGEADTANPVSPRHH